MDFEILFFVCEAKNICKFFLWSVAVFIKLHRIPVN